MKFTKESRQNSWFKVKGMPVWLCTACKMIEDHQGKYSFLLKIRSVNRKGMNDAVKGLIRNKKNYTKKI